MSRLEVPLESILPALQGAIPTPFATCSADGTPNVTYLSIVHHVDAERVALSRQFMNKSRANLDANPQSQVIVLDPREQRQYALDLVYLHTETSGPLFEALRAKVEAIATSTEAAKVLRLRGVDVHRVEACVALDGGAAPAAVSARDDLRRLDELVTLLAPATDYDEVATIALQALDDVFGIDHSVLYVPDEDGRRLFAAATNGYPVASAGAEVVLGTAIAGVAAERRQVVVVANVRDQRQLIATAQERAGLGEAAIPVPTLADVRIAAAIPLVAGGRLIGVLALESPDAGAFAALDQRTLRVAGGQVAAALAAASSSTAAEPAPAPEDAAPILQLAPRPSALEVAYYQADDSVFVGGDYVIKGVPGRILFKLLREHAADGRTAFTNRELRLDEALGLPAGNDNLEARLLTLRRRLAGGDFGVGLERVARGRLELQVAGPVELAQVATDGPMRAAHEGG